MEPSPPSDRAGAALLLDAAGTLLHPSRPVAETYAQAAARHGVRRSAEAIAAAFGPAMGRHGELRRGDPTWRAYWRAVVAASVGADDGAVFEDLYAHFARPEAWRLSPGAVDCIRAVRGRGWVVAVVSNWDIRLRPLLAAMPELELDAIVVSGEEGVEKPDPEIFLRACRRLGVTPAQATMVGDSVRHDLEGARAAGIPALHLGSDALPDFAALRSRLLKEPRSTP